MNAGAVPPLTAPGARFLCAHLSHLVALGFGSGLSRRAPGTVGTLWGWAAFLLIQALWRPTDAVWAALIGGGLLLGWWASVATVRRCGVADPGYIVIDEIVAFWLVLWLAMPMGLLGQAVAFGLFRFFDAAKPGPVGWADRAFKGGGWRGGWGIMFDDLVAAFCTLLVLALWRWV
ncbi:phosphatidylglycerophosphatase A [Aquabacterium sp. A08]|uniref:phosphatidylglycerophosphatase A family protein n=1 Tax=Aquabacterium sp. A08 TaxID=2718532 RepID=UPI001421E3B1|nr:phosphatidylglycerophosphatase A [Aquabacterium sp. A08]NIC41345.1 phosphatidylglycerophosphatase A [Aquabacterium sp. A08]NIC41350.1 phosphatidylglycerophosphatase A [Aquabacterium sp. A08]